jgi:hypothetical protein
VVKRRGGGRGVNECHGNWEVVRGGVATFHARLDRVDIDRGGVTATSSDHALEDVVRVETVISSQDGVGDVWDVRGRLVQHLVYLAKIMINSI